MISVIGVGGPAGAGKDSLCAALTESGCLEFYSGGYVRERAKKDGFIPADPTREAYVPYWQEVAKKEGEDWLAQEAFRLHEELGSTVLFNGVRIPADAAFIGERGGLSLYMHADTNMLFQRIADRARLGDPRTREEYDDFHTAEMDGSNSINMGGVAERSDHFLLPVQAAEGQDIISAYRPLAQYILSDLAL